MSLTVETINSIYRLEELRNEWNSLFSRSLSKHIAVTHEFISTWWRAFGQKKKLRIVAVRRDGKLTCIAPLVESTARVFGLSIRQIRTFYKYYEPVCDFMLAEDAAQAVGPLWKHLRSNPKARDVVELSSVPTLSQTSGQLENVARRDGFLLSIREGDPCPFVDTSGTWESYLASKGAGRRSNWNRLEKKAAQKGGVSVLSITTADDLDHYLALGFDIEASGWKGRTGTAILSDPQTHSFYVSLAKQAARKGWLALHFLILDDEPIAFLYNFRFGGIEYHHKMGYLEKWASIAPGKLLSKRTIAKCFQDGLRLYDLQGGPNRLKLEFATGSRRRFRVRIYNHTFKGCLLFAADCILVSLYKKLVLLARSRTVSDFWRHTLSVIREYVFSNEPVLVFEKDLAHVQPIEAELPGLSFHLATAKEIFAVATDPEYLLSREEAQQTLKLHARGDVCVLGKVRQKIVHYHWVQFSRQTLSQKENLDLAGENPFVSGSRTLANYRGKGIFSAALCYTYSFLKARGFSECHVAVHANDLPSVRQVEKTGTQLVARFRLVSLFGIKRTLVPRRLLNRVAVSQCRLRREDTLRGLFLRLRTQPNLFL